MNSTPAQHVRKRPQSPILLRRPHYARATPPLLSTSQQKDDTCLRRSRPGRVQIRATGEISAAVRSSGEPGDQGAVERKRATSTRCPAGALPGSDGSRSVELGHTPPLSFPFISGTLTPQDIRTGSPAPAQRARKRSQPPHTPSPGVLRKSKTPPPSTSQQGVVFS
jgi:hypothetical protein